MQRPSHTQPDHTYCKDSATILRKSFERKIEDILGEDQFGFRRGKGSRDETGILIIISERTLDIGEGLCACFIDWQGDLQILKLNGIDWRERRIIRKLCMDQCIKLKLDQEETRKVKIGRGVRQ